MEKQNGGESTGKVRLRGPRFSWTVWANQADPRLGKKNTLHRIHTLLVVQPNTTGALPNI